MAKQYIVELTDDERVYLLELTKKGRLSARKLKRAHILLLSDEGKLDQEIVEALHVGLSTVERTRKKLVERGLEYALNERPHPGAQPRLDEKGQAMLETLARSAPPKGRKRWTLQLLADRLMELRMVESISDETVRRELKKRSCGLQGETGHHQASEEVGGDSLEIVCPLKHGHVESQELLVNTTERT